ncbi:PAS domain-containing protein [Sneathiella sp.]|uniref:PAS domain-containing protein n=1 Tax=Sneathiella sp. TaxID=1964365 RepID=UPI002630D2D8|nr:PAS domain-containing protein [Sneathiella sp.]MDF2365809.1 PAS domain-containing protein [Sneathiella sp.]
MSSETLVEIRDYWLELKKNRLMPLKQEFNPAAIARHLPYVLLADVVQDPLRFRYRLLGTRITELAGRDATGKWLDEDLYGDKTDDILWLFRNCASTKQPIAVREQIQFVDRSWVTVDVVAFPLGDTDGNMTVILSAVDLTHMDASLPSPGTTFILDWQATEATSHASPDTQSVP